MAIFIDDVKSDDTVSLKTVKCTTKIKTRLLEINKFIDEYIDYEYYLGIENYEYWNIHYDYIDVAYSWASGESLATVLGKIETYEGNFLRNILKISNIARDLVFLSHTCGNLTIIPALEEVDKKIIRDIVTVNSLYV